MSLAINKKKKKKTKGLFFCIANSFQLHRSCPYPCIRISLLSPIVSSLFVFILSILHSKSNHEPLYSDNNSQNSLFCSFKLQMATAFTSIRGEASNSHLNFVRSISFSLLCFHSIDTFNYLLPPLLLTLTFFSDFYYSIYTNFPLFYILGAAGFAFSYMWRSIFFSHQAQESVQFLDRLAGF